jgi:general stress protein 26
MSDDQQQHAWTMMADMKFCHLITRHGGRPSSKPMTALADAKARTLHILASTDGPTITDIQGDGNVLLTFSNGSEKNLVVEAIASVSNDRRLIKSLWNPGAQAFWPKGPDTSEVRALVLDPRRAEYWEGSGGMVGALKFAVAIATKSRPSGEHVSTAL